MTQFTTAGMTRVLLFTAAVVLLMERGVGSWFPTPRSHRRCRPSGHETLEDWGSWSPTLATKTTTSQGWGTQRLFLFSRLLKKTEQRANAGKKRPSGAKARTDFAAFAARLKSCPVTKRDSERVFPQPAHRALSIQAALQLARTTRTSLLSEGLRSRSIPLARYASLTTSSTAFIRSAAVRLCQYR